MDLGDSVRKHEEVTVSRRFPSLNRNVFCQSRGIKPKISNKMKDKWFLYKLSHKHFDDRSNSLNFLNVTIAAMKKKSLKNAGDVLHDWLNLGKRDIKQKRYIFSVVLNGYWCNIDNLVSSIKGNLKKMFVKFTFPTILWNLLIFPPCFTYITQLVSILKDLPCNFDTPL